MLDADRFANVFVSMNTLGVIIAITHIAGYIATRRGKNRRLKYIPCKYCQSMSNLFYPGTLHQDQHKIISHVENFCYIEIAKES